MSQSHASAAAGTPARQTTVQKLARQFAAEWCRPDAPEHATQVLVDTLSTAMLAFHAVARGVEERMVGPAPKRIPRVCPHCGEPEHITNDCHVSYTSAPKPPVSGEGTGTLTLYDRIRETGSEVGAEAKRILADVDATLAAMQAKVDQFDELPDVVNRLEQALAAKDAQLAELRAKLDNEIELGTIAESLTSREVERQLRSTLADLRRQGEAYAAWLWNHNEGADRVVAEKLREILGRPLPDPPAQS